MCVTQNTPWRVGVCFPQTCNRTADPTAEAALCGTNSYCSDGDRRLLGWEICTINVRYPFTAVRDQELKGWSVRFVNVFYG